MYAQHRSDAPDHRATGWGSFESADLLGWRWTGLALPPREDGWAYSGSGVRTAEGLELFHTVHDPRDDLQHQRRLLPDTPEGWLAAKDDPALARPAANRRDPFVFAWEGEWRMLLTQSCGWHDWSDDPPSQLVVLASTDRAEWREVGRIGPWHPQGVLWEVPVITRLDGSDVLILSLVDQREGQATCSVRAWLGRFDGTGFTKEVGFPDEGQLVDLGPDHYALVPGIDGDWPGSAPFVAWASSWRTARAPIWPDFAGGPITIPRRLEVRERGGRRRVHSTPWRSVASAFRPAAQCLEGGLGVAEVDGSAAFELTVAGPEASLLVQGDPGSGLMAGRREATDAFAWSAQQTGTVFPATRRRLSLFVDGPLLELFDEASGTSLTAALPGGATSVALAVGQDRLDFSWSVYQP